MARVFAGNEQLVDPEVFEAVKRLSNDYFVFAEFDIDRRNIDWLIIRAASGNGDDAQTSAAILTEMKRISAPITGTVQDEWRVERLDGTIEVVSGGQEKNPYWQAVSGANALRAWLWNHHRLFCDDTSGGPEIQESNFSVWPDVLILPRREQRLDHRLPVRPTNGFGMWWFDLERWLNHVETWRPNQRDRTRRYTESELVRLAALLDTHEVHDGRKDGTPPAPVAIAPPHPIASFEPVAAYFRALEDQVASLTSRVAQLEVLVDQLEMAFPDQSPDPERNGNGDRNGTREPAPAEPVRTNGAPVDHAQALIEIARGYAEANKRAVFPAVLKDLERRLGVSLKQSNYDGLGSARAWFDQAVERGIIRYGPEDESGAPTILPGDEEPSDRARRRTRA
ncbi:MAG: hypothetical protein IT334_03165 [Thermomicrobiales bacterium]|nr:hypothetical protein [Thermomicrobiales bacterium]